MFVYFYGKAGEFEFEFGNDLEFELNRKVFEVELKVFEVLFFKSCVGPPCYLIAVSGGLLFFLSNNNTRNI